METGSLRRRQQHLAEGIVSILLFPGMGVDQRMYAELMTLVPGITVAPWNEPTAPSIPDYARTYLPLVEKLRPDVIGGASFGGMVALEIARVIKPKQVILIGGCRNRKSVQGMLRFSARYARFIPRFLLRPRLGMYKALYWYYSVRDPAHRAAFTAMIRETSPSFLQWACEAVSRWDGVDRLDCPIAQIHGGIDHLMPAKYAQADEIVPEAGHMIAMTHPKAVADFMRRTLASAGLTETPTLHGGAR